jgi:hypothetical protein
LIINKTNENFLLSLPAGLQGGRKKKSKKKYPLLTQKRADGEARSASTFKQILSLWSMNLFKLFTI